MGAATSLAPVVAESSPNSSAASVQTAPNEQINHAGLEVLQGFAVAGYRWFESHGESLERKASVLYGPMFRQIRDAMKDQGARNDIKKKKGARDTGFRAWLAAHNVPHTTIYGWIKEDEIRTGDCNPPKPKQPKLALTTSYGSVRSPAPGPQEPKPESAERSADSASSKPVTKKFFFSQLEADEFDRLEHELRPHLNTGNPSDTVLAALRNVHHVFVTTASLRGITSQGETR
jgi:hypothetical protein